MNRFKGFVIVFIGVVAAAGVLLVTTLDRGSGASADDGRRDSATENEAPSAEQLAALADGVVTEDELRQALNRAGDCLEANGVTALRPGHPQLEGNLVLGSFYPDGVDPQAASAVVRQCNERHALLLSAKFAEAR